MRAKVNKEKLESNLISDLKSYLPNNKLNFAGGLALINGLAILYKKALEEYSVRYEELLDKKVQEVIYAKFLEQLGEESRFEILFDEYLELLPAEFKDLIDKNLFKKKKITRAELENEITRLSYKVLERIVTHGMRETGQKMPDRKELNNSLNEYKSTQKLLKRSKSLSSFKKDVGKNLLEVKRYLKTLAKKTISNLVGYCNNLSDSVLRYYSTREIDIENMESRDLLQLGSDEEYHYKSNQDIERGL